MGKKKKSRVPVEEEEEEEEEQFETPSQSSHNPNSLYEVRCVLLVLWKFTLCLNFSIKGAFFFSTLLCPKMVRFSNC